MEFFCKLLCQQKLVELYGDGKDDLVSGGLTSFTIIKWWRMAGW
jgi:hypothetical protein